MNGIRNSTPSEVIHERIDILNNYFTYLIYSNVCRSLFERHKLLFSFILTTRIMQGNGDIDALEWRFLISGQSPRKASAPNPAPDWITELMWDEVLWLAGLPAMAGIESTFKEDIDGVRLRSAPDALSSTHTGSLIAVCGVTAGGWTVMVVLRVAVR